MADGVGESGGRGGLGRAGGVGESGGRGGLGRAGWVGGVGRVGWVGWGGRGGWVGWVGVALALHAASLAAQWISAPRLDVGMSVSLYVLAAACVGWPLTRGQREARTLLAALAGLAAAGPVLFYAERPPPSPVLLAHLLPGILAYAFALVALAQFIGLRATEQRLKSGKMEVGAPPILELEASCFRSVAAAFGLLTLTLMTGAFQAALTPDFRLWTHKNIFAGLTWLAFCALLIGRRTHGWRGKSARTWAAAAFALLALSYFGSHFVLQVLLER